MNRLNTQSKLSIMFMFIIAAFVVGGLMVSAGTALAQTDTTSSNTSACSTNGTLTLGQVRSATQSGGIHVVWAQVGGTETVTITNTTGKFLPVSLISYQMFDQNLGSQQFFDGTDVTNVDSCTPTTLIVNLPSCMAQIDLYFGAGPHVLFDDNRGSATTLSWAFFQNSSTNFENAAGNFCPTPIATPPTATSTLTIIKNIINDDSGNATSSNFTINVTNNATTTAIVSSSTSDVIVLDAGTFSVNPVATSTYTSSTSGSCSGAVPTTPITCTITFNDVATSTDGGGGGGGPTATSTLIVINNLVNNNGGTSTPSDFIFTITGSSSTPATFPGSATGTPVTINAGTAYSVGEATSTTYAVTFSADCSGILLAGQTKTCTVTNDDIAPAGSTAAPAVVTSSGSRGGRSGQFAGNSAPQGEVLGASTSCGPYLNSYLRIGYNNDSGEVIKLQVFLNEQMGSNLSVTGFFSQPTNDAVNSFQLKYKAEVLLPWVVQGLPNENTPTGYVYKTTKYMINKIKCPSLGLITPPLP